MIRLAAKGFILGVLAWAASWQLTLHALPPWSQLAEDPLGLWLAAACGMVLAAGIRTAPAQRRMHRVAWSITGLVSLSLFLIGTTPASMRLAQGLVRRDPLQPADAVYVLGTGVKRDGTLPTLFQVNVLHAYEIIGQGYAPRLIVPRIAPVDKVPSALPELRRQMRALRVRASVEEVGPVWTTADEARAVAALVRAHKWHRVIVVSWPAHMRRVQATFQQAGVPVLCSPGPETEVDYDTANTIDRCTAFRSWLHETLGYQMYRLRGRTPH